MFRFPYEEQELSLATLIEPGGISSKYGFVQRVDRNLVFHRHRRHHHHHHHDHHHHQRHQQQQHQQQHYHD